MSSRSPAVTQSYITGVVRRKGGCERSGSSCSLRGKIEGGKTDGEDWEGRRGEGGMQAAAAAVSRGERGWEPGGRLSYWAGIKKKEGGGGEERTGKRGRAGGDECAAIYGSTVCWNGLWWEL